jgi:MutS domain I
VGIKPRVVSKVCDSRPKPKIKTDTVADTEADTEAVAIKGLSRIPRAPRGPTSLKREIDQLQTQYPNHVLLVQVGMFYEIYNNVDEIAQILGLRIANNKTRHDGQDCFNRFAGFPTISLKSHLECLVQHGKTVAIATQQKQSPPQSDVIIRKVTRIVTPGTMIDELDSKDQENHYLLSLFSCAPLTKANSLPNDNSINDNSNANKDNPNKDNPDNIGMAWYASISLTLTGWMFLRESSMWQ